MSEFERLAQKLDEAAKDHSGRFDHLVSKLAELHTDMEVLKAQRSETRSDLVELKGRVAVVEEKQVQAAISRAWMMGAAATAGAVGGKFVDWILGRGQ
jgi:hypothetical protein